MSRACFRLLLASGLLAVTTLAPAQTKKAQPAKFAAPGATDSVSTGSKDGPSRGRRAPAARARADAAVATFPGFRLLPDGKSRIYVELTRSVSVDERHAEGMLIYVLHDARVPVRNNRNALITTHFPTPVARARLHSAGNNVELLIDLRKGASASYKLVPGENGGARLEVDFPAGDYPPVSGLFEPPAAKGRGRDAEQPDVGPAAPAEVAAPAPVPAENAASPAAASAVPPGAPPAR
jgi:hypothetical protein